MLPFSFLFSIALDIIPPILFPYAEYAFTKPAVLIHLESVWVIPFVFHGVVVSLFAFCAKPV